MSPQRRIAWLVVLCGMIVWTASTTRQALARYDAYRTGWSWDLAYYNQWLWSLSHGEGTITVRPLASYAIEGPPFWRTTYLAPIRLALVPLHRLWPDPRLLLVVQCVVVGWLVPASYRLVREESQSELAGVVAAGLVPWTPLVGALVANDFRELQLALPFLVWTIDGWRGRSFRLTALGIGGLLACRQEFALVVATLGLVPPRVPEPVGRSFRWARAALGIGLGWMLFGFFGYLELTAASNAPMQYVGQFGGAKPSLFETTRTALNILVLGVGPWALLAVAAPGVAWVALPWLWQLASGRWGMFMLATASWHHVRYTAPMVGLALAAGLVGFATVWRVAGRWGRAEAWARALLAVLTLAGLLTGRAWVDGMLDRVPPPISAEDALAMRRLARNIGPEDGVLAAYEVTGPLSSRRALFSYVLEPNRPRGYPDNLEGLIRWVIIRRGDVAPERLLAQGFQIVHEGPDLIAFRR